MAPRGSAAAWGHGSYTQGNWKGSGSHGKRSSRKWSYCSCGAWVWDSDKKPVCEQCGESSENGQVESRNSGKAQPVEARLPAKAVISEDKHAALLAILQAAGGQLGLDLQSMLGPNYAAA